MRVGLRSRGACLSGAPEKCARGRVGATDVGVVARRRLLDVKRSPVSELGWDLNSAPPCEPPGFLAEGRTFRASATRGPQSLAACRAERSPCPNTRAPSHPITLGGRRSGPRTQHNRPHHSSVCGPNQAGTQHALAKSSAYLAKREMGRWMRDPESRVRGGSRCMVIRSSCGLRLPKNPLRLLSNGCIRKVAKNSHDPFGFII